MRNASKEVDAYIAGFPKAHQRMMKQLRTAIRAAAPTAVEQMSYQMPFYRYKLSGYAGRLTYFGAFKHHVSLFAWGKKVDALKEITRYKTSKGTIQFPLGTKIPIGLVRKIIQMRVKEIDGSVTRKKTALRNS